MLIADTPYPLYTKHVGLSSGISLAYTEMGQGFPLLLVHGLGSYIPAWTKNLPFLSKHFRCIAIDLPGYGKSSKEGFTAGMEFYADVVKEFLDKLHINECYLAGHSMGGQISMHAALKYPQKVKKLALLAPAGIETFEKREAVQLNSWFEVEKVYNAGVAVIGGNIKANFHRFPPDAQSLVDDRINYKSCLDYRAFCQVLSDSVRAMIQEPVLERLPELQMSVLILFGRQDAYIPVRLIHLELEVEEVVQLAIERIPHGAYHYIDACGHFLQWEGAEEVNQQLLDFFGK
jgi:pimeloyl-ACP methyl ester carboxylesterase